MKKGHKLAAVYVEAMRQRARANPPWNKLNAKRQLLHTRLSALLRILDDKAPDGSLIKELAAEVASLLDGCGLKKRQ